MMSKVLLRNSSPSPVGVWTVDDEYIVVPAMREMIYIVPQLAMASEAMVNALIEVGTMESIAWVAPNFKYKPTLSTNNPVSGSTLILDAGRPGSLPGPRIEIKWFADGAQVEGEAKSSMKVRPEHVGKKIYASVKASNIISSVEEATDETNPAIDGTLPVNVEPPVIQSGEAKVGSTLLVSMGEWTGEGIITYGWQSAASASGPWSVIKNADQAGYKVQDADVGRYIRGMNKAQKTQASPMAYAYTDPVGPVFVAPGGL